MEAVGFAVHADAALAGVALRQAWGLFHPLANIHSLEITEAGNAPGDLEGLLANLLPKDNEKNCQIQRDRTWLEWRYSPASEQGYVWVLVRRGGTLEALLIYRRENERRLLIAETLGSREAMAAGIRHIVEKAQSAKPVMIVTLTSDRSTIDALKANGFIRRDYKRLIVKSLTSRLLPASIHHHDAWKLFGGDFDVF
jgi:hypothetical protein